MCVTWWSGVAPPSPRRRRRPPGAFQVVCLVLNAGLIGLGGVALSSQNHQMTFAVNHLGHWLLTRLLLPTLRAAAPARVVVVASNAPPQVGLRLHGDVCMSTPHSMQPLAQGEPKGHGNDTVHDGPPRSVVTSPARVMLLCRCVLSRVLGWRRLYTPFVPRRSTLLAPRNPILVAGALFSPAPALFHRAEMCECN